MPARELEVLPGGAMLGDMAELLGDDLVSASSLDDVVGNGFEPGAHREVPRIRPILVTLAARATGDGEVSEDAQMAAELLHTALLVHDVALGRGGGRRRRVARKLVRVSAGWLMGNHLVLRALELSRSSQPEVMHDLVDTLRAFQDAQALADSLIGECAGVPDWEEHADSHTGALFQFCCRSGGHASRASERDLLALARYGRHMGRLWHIAEDLAALDHGDAESHLVSRALTGRPILPVILTETAESETLWKKLAAEGDATDASELLGLLGPGVVRAREAMVAESWKAMAAVRRLPESRYRQAMERLATGIARAAVPRQVG